MSYFCHCYEQTDNKKQLMKERTYLVPNMVRMVWKIPWLQECLAETGNQREGELAIFDFLLLSFSFSLEPQHMEQCQLHSGWPLCPYAIS